MPDTSNLVNCGTCGYPHSDDGTGCPNPACFANPSMTEATKARMTMEHGKHIAIQVDREEFRRIKARAIQL